MDRSNRNLLVPIGTDNPPNGDGQPVGGKYSAFGLRVQEAAVREGFSAARLAKRLNMTSGTFSRYWNGDRLPPSDVLIDLAEELKVSPKWLISGKYPSNDGVLLDASDADFEWVPRFDLRELRDEGKGEPIDWTPFRKDWLARTLGTSLELWLTTLLSDYPSKGLYEGDLVFCREIEPHELADNNICLFRINGGVVIGRFSLARTIEIGRGVASAIAGYRASGAYLTSQEDLVVASSEVGIGDDFYVPVARILGKCVQRL